MWKFGLAPCGERAGRCRGPRQVTALFSAPLESCVDLLPGSICKAVHACLCGSSVSVPSVPGAGSGRGHGCAAARSNGLPHPPCRLVRFRGCWVGFVIRGLCFAVASCPILLPRPYRCARPGMALLPREAVAVAEAVMRSSRSHFATCAALLRLWGPMSAWRDPRGAVFTGNVGSAC